MDQHIKLAMQSIAFYHEIWYSVTTATSLCAILNVQALEPYLDLDKLLVEFSFSFHETLRKWPYSLIEPRGLLYMLHSQLYKLAMPRLHEAKLPINAWQFHKYWAVKCIWVCHKHPRRHQCRQCRYKWPPVLLIYMEADRMSPWSEFIIACKSPKDHN